MNVPVDQVKIWIAGEAIPASGYGSTDPIAQPARDDVLDILSYRDAVIRLQEDAAFTHDLARNLYELDRAGAWTDNALCVRHQQQAASFSAAARVLLHIELPY